MAGDDADLVYPNPGSGKRWEDHQGRVWQRRGDCLGVLDEKRTRTLMRRAGVPLATWWAGEVLWADDLEAKAAAAQRLYAAAVRAEDVVASEWRTEDGAVLLLLEHHC